MEHRELGRTGLRVGEIGLGTEHLTAPEVVTPVIQRAIDAGINYIDMMVWTSEGRERLGAALRGRRDGVILASHLGAADTGGQYRRTRDPVECRELWHDLLRRLGTTWVDVLHIHYLDSPADYERVVAPGGVLEVALRLKQEGKARYLSLSGHSPRVALQAIEDGHLDLVMHPVFIGNAADQERTRLFELCAGRGVGLVAMKTFAGGWIFQRRKAASPMQCMHYSLSQPGVSTVLVGVRNIQELEEDLRYLEAGAEEKGYASLLADVQQGLEGTCLYCNHCLPCPSEIDIGLIMRTLPDVGEVDREMQADYDSLPVKASACSECGQCEERCPFGVEIIAGMRRAVELFEGGG